MKIFLILDETIFFQPKLIDDYIKHIGSVKFGGAVLIKSLNKKNSIPKFFISKIHKFKITEIILFALYIIKKKIKFFLSLIIFSKYNYNVSSVLKKHKIEFIEANLTLKNNEIINFIKSKKPKLIICSCSLYIPKEIYESDVTVINRHSGKLPFYAGLLPIFHSICNNEKDYHVDINYVNKKIDKGDVIVSISFKNRSNSFFKIYKESFEKSLIALIKATKILKSKRIKTNFNKDEKYYNSFPDDSSWNKFRDRKFKLITLGDLID
tara:strand:- start:314 stop:1111 length:798 start_codon:yes stop_codon:yes gene_type:complete